MPIRMKIQASSSDMPRYTVPIDRDLGFHMSQREVAEHLGVTPQAIYETERRALKKLRKALIERGYSASDFFDEAEGICV